MLFVRYISYSNNFLNYTENLKMKSVLVLLVLACLSAAVCGDLVCGTNYCRDHPCTSPLARSSCRPPAQYREKHAGRCACCPACVTLLNEGAACKTYSQELGETPSQICKSPLRCVNGVCIAVARRN